VAVSDNPGGGALNLWFNANGQIVLPASNTLSGTLTLQNSLARQAGGACDHDAAEPDAARTGGRFGVRYRHAQWHLQPRLRTGWGDSSQI